MHIPEFLAWSWTGHGALTGAAVTAAISQFVTLGKSLLEKRFVEIYKVWQGPPGKTSAQDCLQEMMTVLPGIVQQEDIHPANIPVIGEALNPKSGQVRHFMRSSASVSSLDAYNASKSYIIEHLTGAWSKYREAVYYQDKWYDVLTSSSSIFWEGHYELGKSLHTIEDSYAPGHVTRKSGSGFIVQVNIWDDENKNPDPSRDWPGHEALDNPNHEKSREFYAMAKETTASLIVCVLRNLDQDQAAFTKDLKDSVERYFHLGLAFENDPSDLMQQSDTLPA
jgi:hypothetical protein